MDYRRLELIEQGLPQATESEEIVLAQMIKGYVEPAVIFAQITPAQFGLKRNQLIAEIVAGLDRDGMTPEPSMVYQVARQEHPHAGLFDPLMLINDQHQTSQLNSHISKIRKAYVLRSLHEKLSALSVLALDPSENADDLFARAQSELEKIQGDSKPSGDDLERPIVTARKENQDLYDWANPKEQKPLCPIPFKGATHLIDGFREGELVVIGARPGQGKTALACRLIEEASGFHSVPTALFTLEMTKQANISRIAAGLSEVSSKRARLGDQADFPLSRADALRYRQAFSWIESWPLEVSSTRNTKVSSIRAAIRPKIGKQVQMLVIDYLGLLSPERDRENRYAELSEITRSLKNMAMEFRIPIIVLHQLSRESAKRGGPPVLTDLRDSGSIEQDADIVLLINQSSSEEPVNDAAMIIAKQREGPTGSFKLEFVKQFARFREPGEESAWKKTKEFVQESMFTR